MNSSQLECFIVLTKTLNFTKAAESMFITQPAFSRRIASLEEEIGARLFERHYQDVRLTTAGERFLPYCLRASCELKEGSAQARLCEKGTCGQLRIGILCDSREEKVAKLICLFKERYPEAALAVEEYTHLKAKKALDDRNIDIGFFNSQNMNDMENLRTRVLDTSFQCVVVAENHPLARFASVSAKQLSGEKFILLAREDSLYYDVLRRICALYGFEPQVIRWAQAVPAIFTHVGYGAGVSFLSGKTSLLAPKSIKYVPLAEAGSIDHLAVWKEDNINPCLLNFINMID